MTARLPSLRQPCTLGRALLFSSTKQDLGFSRKTKETTSDSEPAVSLRTRMNHRVASDRPDHAVTPFECRRRVAPLSKTQTQLFSSFRSPKEVSFHRSPSVQKKTTCDGRRSSEYSLRISGLGEQMGEVVQFISK